jgi:hypothetical protein
LVGLKKLHLMISEGLTALPARLGRLPNLEDLRLLGCPGLAALHGLQRREGLPALLAHLAAQAKTPPPAYATGALAASPFALLDARGCLRLVTDAVHEDAALCLALACRARRDALGARFPACPRAGGREVARLAARVTADGVLDLSYDPDGESDGYESVLHDYLRHHHHHEHVGHDDDYLRGLRVLPEGFGRLAYLPAPGLRKLDLSDKRGLSLLPAGLCALRDLEELDLPACGLTALPRGSGRWPACGRSTSP